jgi:hypothetical protein
MRITELCGSQLEQHVEKLFAVGRLQAIVAGEKYATVPYLDDRFPVNCEPLFPHFKRMVVAALLARKSFEQQKPNWAPSLPLTSTDIDSLLRNTDPKFNLVGYFAASWACTNWSKFHPAFFVYGSGVMACPDTPEHIRTDLRLLQEFPPTLLAELDETLCWNTFERNIDFTQQLMRQEEHLHRCGMLADAKRMRGIIKHITGINEIYPD